MVTSRTVLVPLVEPTDGLQRTERHPDSREKVPVLAAYRTVERCEHGGKAPRVSSVLLCEHLILDVIITFGIIISFKAEKS